VIFVFVLLKRQSDQSVEMNRLLERNIKQSRCLDVESLCIRAGEKVWQIRVDLNVLNHDGNILDCANMALIASLAHFKLPEVSVTGDEIKIVNLFFLYSIRKRDGSLSNILT
jgi:exosome complex component RRP45